MFTFLEPKTNGSVTAKLLSDLLNVKISTSSLKKEIEEHPDYPSLLSISDILGGYGIENVGIKFDHDKFENIPTPFITELKIEKSDDKFFSVVKSTNNATTIFFDPEKNNWESIANQNFLKKCTGIALLVEARDDAGEKDFNKKVKAENITRFTQYLTALCIPAIVIVAGIFGFIQNGLSMILPFAFCIFTLAGCIIGTLLLWYEIDQHNPLLQQICSGGKKVNCSAVLHSKAAKIAGVSWSVIGLSYFIGILLLLLFGGLANHSVLFIAAWINTAAAPYVVFSVYYQWRIAKQWCVLCLCVQVLLMLQLITALVGGWHTVLPFNSITPSLLIQTLTAFTVPFFTIAILLPALKKTKESQQVNAKLQRLKHNSQIFEALLHKQKQIIESPEGLGITLGNLNAAYKLIKVCNPYCGPCAKAHKPMEDLLHNNPDVQIQVLFTATNNEGDIKTPPVKHLLAIAEHNGEETVKHALDYWYLAEKKDYEVFAAKYPMNGELKLQNTKIEAMKQWCDKVKIDFTPTFFVAIPDNEGLSTTYYQLPEIYNLTDLKYFFAVG